MITAANPLAVERVAGATNEVPRHTVEIESYSSDFAVLRAAGDLDLSARASLMDGLNELLRGDTDVVVDLSGVAFIYSGAANAIIDAAAGFAGNVRIFAPTRPVRMILDVLGASHLIVDDYPSA